MGSSIKWFVAVAIVGIAFVHFLGCSTTGRKFDETKVGEIKQGVTTEADLVHMFGPPTHRGVNSDGNTTLMWQYGEAQVKPASFIPIVGLFAGGADVKTQTLTVILGQDGKVIRFDSSGGKF